MHKYKQIAHGRLSFSKGKCRACECRLKAIIDRLEMAMRQCIEGIQKDYAEHISNARKMI